MLQPVAFFKALADETRLQSLLLIMHQQELCVCELMAALDENQPKISRHLAQLRKAGILRDRRQGQWVYYRLADTLPEWATQILQATLQQQEYLLPSLHRLTAMGSRPERTSQCC